MSWSTSPAMDLLKFFALLRKLYDYSMQSKKKKKKRIDPQQKENILFGP